MNQLRRDVLEQLLAPTPPPCISIYMPASPAFPGELEDDPRFDNLVREAESKLRSLYTPLQASQLIDRCRGEVGQRAFWAQCGLGLAVFCSPQLSMTVCLPQPVSQAVIIADSFHIKPLIPMLQTMGRFQVLCLTRKDVRLLEGNRYEMSEAPLKNVPRTIYEAYEREAHLQTAPAKSASANGLQNQPGQPPTGAMSVERWFQTVDKSVWENHSRHDRLPLILCSVEENHDLFHRVSENQYLQPGGIKLDPDHVQMNRIREEAWKLIEPAYQELTRKAIDNFQTARAHHAGDDDPSTVAKSAAEGRVSLLLLEADRNRGGRLDADLLDETVETVLKRGGQVMVIPPELMPTQTGLAAVYRY
jgi:hypothetical protein